MNESLLARVNPFYLKMMRFNATTAEAGLLAAVRESSHAVSAEEVRDLLAADWRPRVMGAWYALAHGAGSVGDALAASLQTSRGDLTAPPLATAALVVLGVDALPSLAFYADEAASNPYLGADGFVAAAAQRLGGQAGVAEPSREDFNALDRMLAVAEVLRRR